MKTLSLENTQFNEPEKTSEQNLREAP